jgi:hypothetical protein
MGGRVLITAATFSPLLQMGPSYMKYWTLRVLGTTRTLLNSCMAHSWIIPHLVSAVLPTLPFCVAPIALIIEFWCQRRKATGHPQNQPNLPGWRFWTNRQCLRDKQHNGGWGRYRVPLAVWSYPCLPPTTRPKPTSFISLYACINFGFDQSVSTKRPRCISMLRTNSTYSQEIFTGCCSPKSSDAVPLAATIMAGFKIKNWSYLLGSIVFVGLNCICWDQSQLSIFFLISWLRSSPKIGLDCCVIWNIIIYWLILSLYESNKETKITKKDLDDNEQSKIHVADWTLILRLQVQSYSSPCLEPRCMLSIDLQYWGRKCSHTNHHCVIDCVSELLFLGKA